MKSNLLNGPIILAFLLVALGLNLPLEGSRAIADRAHNLTSERGGFISGDRSGEFLLSAKDRQTEECQLERRCKPDTAQRLEPVV